MILLVVVLFVVVVVLIVVVALSDVVDSKPLEEVFVVEYTLVVGAEVVIFVVVDVGSFDVGLDSEICVVVGLNIVDVVESVEVVAADVLDDSELNVLGR